VILLSAVAAALAFGCKPHTRDNPDVCLPGSESSDPCAPGLTCMNFHCVAMGGAGGAGGEGDMTGAGGSSGGSGGSFGTGGGAAGGKGSGAAGGKTASGGTSAGGKAGGAGGAGGTPVECTETGTKMCQPPAGPLCLAGKCVQCKSDGDCTGTSPICSADHKCVSCKEANVNACAAHKGATACANTGASAGACVECDTNKDCKDPTKPLCSAANSCIGCVAAGNDTASRDTACMMADKAFPVCATTGACVECGKDTDCSADPKKPFCSLTGTCVGCDPTATGACAVRSPGKPVCSSGGACVQCVVNLDCDSKTPVCSPDNNCGPCSVDNDCGGRYGPVICMTKDGHCVVESETIYVQSSAACVDPPMLGGGSTLTPYCSLRGAPAAITPMRNVVVVRGSVNGTSMPFGASNSQFFIVGQKSALIAGGVDPGLRIGAGDASVRDLTVSNSTAVGIEADTGATLRLQHVTVSNNSAGGILLDGAAFDIQNTLVKNNGPGDMAGALWGGIRIANPPSTGPGQLQNVTVQGNTEVGISCTAAVQGTGVLASGNTASLQITTSCGIMSCATAGPTCGAQ
jgi:hypothetical protein